MFSLEVTVRDGRGETENGLKTYEMIKFVFFRKFVLDPENSIRLQTQ